MKATEVGGERGYDGGKKLTGRKRHIVVDTLGLLMVVAVTTALDDGTGAPEVLAKLTAEHQRRLEKIWGDGKYNNRALDRWLAAQSARYRIEVVQRPLGAKGFVLLHRRWVVERTFAWLGRYRRISRDYERKTSSSEATIKASAIHMMLRRLRPDKSTNTYSFKYERKPAKSA